MAPVTLAVIGAGERGATLSRFALAHPDRLKVVAVAEPRAEYRERLAAAHDVALRGCFDDWRALLEGPRRADAVLVATQDALHRAPAEAALARGYHLLLEKPMAPSDVDCAAIADAARRAGVVFAVCHVLRYTPYTRTIKRLIAEGAVGRVASVERLEPVGHWHQAHSYVRGNWRREDLSSSMLLAKSCHDLDWIRHVVGRPCRRLSSFGSLLHFRREDEPEGAADRCLDCSVEAGCPWSARRIYLERSLRGERGWPMAVLTPDPEPGQIERALREGPYGRCVYRCDNDVVDHQVVAMEFEGGATASFTMTGFTRIRRRETRIFGTRGELRGDGRRIEVFDFLTETTKSLDTEVPAPCAMDGHGGGDYGLMEAFTTAVALADPSMVLSGPDESLETHRMVFAAEEARRRGRVVSLDTPTP